MCPIRRKQYITEKHHDSICTLCKQESELQFLSRKRKCRTFQFISEKRETVAGKEQLRVDRGVHVHVNARFLFILLTIFFNGV